jgi:drug/metabolite transporter (DMT)-like permease
MASITPILQHSTAASAAPVHPPPPQDPPGHPLLEPHLFGTLCGLFSAAVYTAANAFLRAVNDCDPVWASAVKAVPTVLVMVPWLVVMLRRGQKLAPGIGFVLMVAAGGLVGQIFGNVSFQWALGEIGLALTVPLTLGGMIVAAAVLGRIFLHEPVTPRTAVALSLLLAAICVLSLGAGDARESVARLTASPWELAAGVGAGCLAGSAYASLNVVIRYTTLRGMPLPTTIFTVATVGLVALTGLSWLRIGGDQMVATKPDDLVMMLLAGVCNAVAFMALTKSLALTSVVYVNGLNATQAMLAAIAGIVLFGEAASPWLMTGVTLTIVGLLLMTRRRQIEVEP